MRQCAGGILVKDGLILLAKRSSDRAFYPGVWDVIGGHCLDGETPASALVRELAEEIGVRPLAFEEIAVLPEPRPDLHGEHEYHIYVIREWDGDGPVLLGHEHAELVWFTVEKALRLQYAHPGYEELFVKIGKTISPDQGADK